MARGASDSVAYQPGRRQALVQPGHGRREALAEAGVGGQLGEPLRRGAGEHPDRVAGGRCKAAGVDLGEHGRDLGIPRPGEVARQPVERLEALGQRHARGMVGWRGHGESPRGGSAGVMEAVCSARRLARLASRSSPETELPGREGSVA